MKVLDFAGLQTLVEQIKGNFAQINENGKISSSLLPGYVDDVIEFAGMITDSITVTQQSASSDVTVLYSSEKKTFVGKASNGTYYANWVGAGNVGQHGANGVVPDTGKIYVDTTTNKTYRYGGDVSGLVEISSSLSLGTTTGTAFDGGKGAALESKVDKLDALDPFVDSTAASATTTTVTFDLKKRTGVSKTVIIPAASITLAGVMTKDDKLKLNGLQNYTLPTATTSVLGGIKLGSTETAASGISKIPLKADSGVAYIELTAISTAEIQAMF